MAFRTVAAFSFFVLIAGCAHFGPDEQGCWTDQCRAFELQRKALDERQRAEQAEKDKQERVRMAIENRKAECTAALKSSAVAPADKWECEKWLDDVERTERRARWEASGVTCIDRRIDERHIAVSCTLPARNGDADMVTGNEKMYQVAAFAALSAGKEFFVFAGRDHVDGSFSESRTPVQCEERNRGLRALAAGLAAMGPDATTNCTGFGNSTSCVTAVRQRPELPPPQYDCTGGEITKTLLSVSTTEYFELLSAQEAAARDNPQLPAFRRPFTASGIAKLFAGLP
jgi:hypothetical protein